MIKKILLTILIILIGFASMGTIWTAWACLYKSIFNEESMDGWNIFLLVLTAILISMPVWYAWKGTKLIPFITIFPVRILMIILTLLFVQPLLIFFSLWGLWIRS